jgi:REP element-mobilizing transposase RayT
MKDWQSQAHVKWDCKYHVVIVPKYRQRVFFGKRRSQIGKILRDLCRQKGANAWNVVWTEFLVTRLLCEHRRIG